MVNMKVVGLEKLNNFNVGSFWSCFGKSKVILEFLICPNSKLEFFPIWDLDFKLLALIRPFPFEISFGPLKMFCSIQNSEQVLFWQKFDFYSNFGQFSQKDRKG